MSVTRPAVVDNLARTAAQLAADTAHLDALAAAALADVRTPNGLAVGKLTDLPDAIRSRVLHAWAGELGAGGAALAWLVFAFIGARLTVRRDIS